MRRVFFLSASLLVSICPDKLLLLINLPHGYYLHAMTKGNFLYQGLVWNITFLFTEILTALALSYNSTNNDIYL